MIAEKIFRRIVSDDTVGILWHAQISVDRCPMTDWCLQHCKADGFHHRYLRRLRYRRHRRRHHRCHYHSVLFNSTNYMLNLHCWILATL